MPASKLNRLVSSTSKTQRNVSTSSNRKVISTGVSVRSTKAVANTLAVSQVDSSMMFADAPQSEMDMIHAALRDEHLEPKLQAVFKSKAYKNMS